MHEFLAQLRKRRVFRTVGAYLIVAAGAVEISDIMVPRLGLPDVTVSVVVWLAGGNAVDIESELEALAGELF